MAKRYLSSFGLWHDLSLPRTGINVLNRSGNKLSYVVYNLSTGKTEQDSVFPTDTQAFIGASERAISLHNGGEVTWFSQL